MANNFSFVICKTLKALNFFAIILLFEANKFSNTRSTGGLVFNFLYWLMVLVYLRDRIQLFKKIRYMVDPLLSSIKTEIVNS